MERLKQANEYIKKKRPLVYGKYVPKYHLSSLIGWMNDPNGFIYYRGKYHVFYQYNPYDIKWGPMHWGHAESEDLLNWTYNDVALAPSEKYDHELGCFSGSAYVKDNQLYLFYTGVSEGKQTQNIAFLNENNGFIKYDKNPVIDESILPNKYKISDFRDPCIIEDNGVYYSAYGVRKDDTEVAIILFKSKNLIDWEYVNELYTQRSVNGGMLECPNLVKIDGYDVLIMSPQFAFNRERIYDSNGHGVMYIIGKIDYEKGVFINQLPAQEMDLGFDFYATQVTLDKNNNPLLIAWASRWDREYPTHSYGWVGQLTIPRLLSIRNGKLIQNPINTNSIVEKEKVFESCSRLIINNKIPAHEIEVKIDTSLMNDDSVASIKLAKDGDEEIVLTYSHHERLFTLNRLHSGLIIKNNDGEISDVRYVNRKCDNDIIDLKIIIDVSIMEVFIDDGSLILTSNFYKEKEDYDIHFLSNEKVYKQIIFKTYKEKEEILYENK